MERFNKTRIRCPVVIHEEINEFFLERKTQKIPDFQHFHAFFSYFR